MNVTARLLAAACATVLTVACTGGDSQTGGASEARASFDKLARDVRTRDQREAAPLVGEAHALWASGKRDEAIARYSDVIRVDSSNPYGHFGLGISQALSSADGKTENPIAYASLRFYLDSNVDRGTGDEFARRSAAQAALAPLSTRRAQQLEDADGYDLHEGLRRVKVDGKWGFIDAVGATIIPPQFELAKNFSEGMAPVRQAGRWGYIDRTGTFVIAPQFADALSFERGVGQVTPQGEQSGFYRFIDRQGRFTNNPDYPARR
jgi:hypothetical protein